MILPTPNPISLPWSNQPCPSSSPGDPEKWSQAQVWSKTPGAPLALWKSWGDVTSVLASPTCRVLPRGARPRGLGPPRCSMFHRDLELGAPRLSPKGQNCSSGHFIWPGRSTDPKACWGDLSLSSKSRSPCRVSAPARWWAKLAGREEAATCCHGSEPTYQHLHHSSTGPRCLVAWRERVAWLGGVGGDNGWKPGNWSHLTWPPALTRLPRSKPHSLPPVEEEA